jgi:hypothetical protein
MDRQYRSDPKYAEEIISTLWPNKQLRRECLQFLLDSIRFAHSQSPAAWEVTLFEDLIRLNVGQIVLLSLRAEEAHVYCLAPLNLPKQSGIHLDTGWSHFAAIPEPTEVYRVDSNLLDTCPKALRDAHFSLIRIAATRKPHSPFKGSFSDGILSYLEKEFDTSIERPTYLGSGVLEPIPSDTTGLVAKRMRSFYTHYWSSTVQRPDKEGSLCCHTAGSGFNKRGITTRDRIYIVTVSHGQLYLIGAFTVAGPTISYDEACQRLPYNPWEAPEHLIAQPGSETPISYSRAIPLETARCLRFYSPEGEKGLKFISENAIDNQTLRGVRRLTAASARLLEEKLFILTEEESIEDFERQIQKSLKDGDEIRRKRLENAPRIPEKRPMFKTDFKRNPDVGAEALRRANGFCEACGKPAPFIRASNGKPYLEIHHKVFLSDGGEDTVENAIALCPNCHREMHFGVK